MNPDEEAFRVFVSSDALQEMLPHTMTFWILKMKELEKILAAGKSL